MHVSNLISYDSSVKLKNNGFKEPTESFYDEMKLIETEDTKDIYPKYAISTYSIGGKEKVRLTELNEEFLNKLDKRWSHSLIAAPTLLQAFEWLMNEKSIYVEVKYDITSKWGFEVKYCNGTCNDVRFGFGYSSYNETLKEGIELALKEML